MRFDNRKYLSAIKRVQLISGVMILIACAVTIFLEQYVVVISLGVLLLMSILLTRILNFNFVRVQIENGKIIIRHYSLYAVDREYQSIEFPVASLRHVRVKKYLFGLKWDLYLDVKLKQGMASYPPVCLSAVPRRLRENLVETISELVRR